MPLTAEDAVLAAKAAGFDAAAVLPLAGLGENSLDAWLSAGNHGEMGYLERHAPLRRDPAAAFPGFSSVLIATAEYGDTGPNPTSPAAGNVSRYALSDDYHRLMKARLRATGDALRRQEPGLRTRPLVDANPLNEKVLAQIGGLGFIGKHSNLIRERQGSWIFCGILLLSEPLDSRPAVAKNRCGTCTRCITACPTAAIVAPFVVDARRCISYLTIELRGPIPREFREAIGNRIFGCDDCQEVCPWNRFAHRGPVEPFRPRDGLQGRPLSEWLGLTETAFTETFAGSTVLRAGYSGFIRNVLVAAGNSGDSTLFEAVAACLEHADPLIRAHAAWALPRIDPQRAAHPIAEALRTETDPTVLAELEPEPPKSGNPPKPKLLPKNSEKK